MDRLIIAVWVAAFAGFIGYEAGQRRKKDEKFFEFMDRLWNHPTSKIPRNL